MSERFQENFYPEQQKEGEVDLSHSVIGIRVFKIGAFDEKSLEQFNRQVEMIQKLTDGFKKESKEKSPQVVIITNSDLPEDGKQILDNSGLTVVQADQKRAERRSELAKTLVGEKSVAKGDFSYADMLNSLQSEETEATAKEHIFMSADFANKPEFVSRQLIGMKTLYDRWQEKKPEKLALVGSLLVGVHDPHLIQETTDGTTDIHLGNLHRIFPNNAFSFVPPHNRFSGITDNALAGNEINGKLELIGGNEDFLYGFESMLYDNKDCILLTDPFVVAGEREGEVKGVASKYERRQKIYTLYARRTIEQAIKRGKLPNEEGSETLSDEQIETIVDDTIDKHLFFASVDENGKTAILLTQRQKRKSISSPL